jgi:hypothetical protein
LQGNGNLMSIDGFANLTAVAGKLFLQVRVSLFFPASFPSPAGFARSHILLDLNVYFTVLFPALQSMPMLPDLTAFSRLVSVGGNFIINVSTASQPAKTFFSSIKLRRVHYLRGLRL